MNKKFWTSGEPFIWGTGALLLMVLILMFGLIGIVLYNGFGVFWPKEIIQIELTDGKKHLGEITKIEYVKKPNSNQDSILGKRIQIKRGNRDIDNLDFVWLDENKFVNQSRPMDAISAEREENGNFIGFIKALVENGQKIPMNNLKFEELKKSVSDKRNKFLEKKKEVYQINQKIGKLKDELKKNIYDHKQDGKKVDADDLKRLQIAVPEIDSIQFLLEKSIELSYIADDPQSHEVLKKIIDLNKEYLLLKSDFEFLEKDVLTHKIVLVDINGVEKTTSISHIVRLIYPNQMTFIDKLKVYFSKIVELFIENPRESNTEGGLFPAILGTVMMVFLMSFLSFPLGVISGVYLREYAKDGLFIRIVRIAVNNLAGIPSIVYGIFGLGFFVYEIGGRIDYFFYPEQLPAPTFGTGGILWASLTLGILTVPVVIVSTEEALGSIPKDIRQGSLALGATKFQTLYGVLLPMASPGILTGFILAMSRAAGEVAPLMITGVVKSAHFLPVDNDWPFIHLDRKFMHLGFQVYDVGFQSPNVEASTPMVYITTLLLLIIVFSLSLGAILLRNKMKKRYTVKSF